MPKKHFSAEQIVVLLRQIKVLMSQGKSAPVACREAGISQQNFIAGARNTVVLRLSRRSASRNWSGGMCGSNGLLPTCRWRSRS